MKKNTMHEGHKKFSANFINVANDIMIAELSGELKCDESLKEFKKFTKQFDEATKEQYERTSRKVNTLMDVSGVSDYNVEAFKIIEESARRNKNYDNKNAIYGAAYPIELLVDAITALTGRSDVKFFKSKEDALDWLRE